MTLPVMKQIQRENNKTDLYNKLNTDKKVTK